MRLAEWKATLASELASLRSAPTAFHGSQHESDSIALAAARILVAGHSPHELRDHAARVVDALFKICSALEELQCEHETRMGLREPNFSKPASGPRVSTTEALDELDKLIGE